MKTLGAEKFKREFADSPKVVAYLEANFQESNTTEWCALIDAADESHFSLRMWVDALIVVGHWLDAHSMEMSMTDQIGYVCCAGEAAGAGANLEHLPALVESMLEQYGCDRATPRQL